jgi:hypothetical protein
MSVRLVWGREAGGAGAFSGLHSASTLNDPGVTTGSLALNSLPASFDNWKRNSVVRVSARALGVTTNNESARRAIDARM